MTPTTRTRRDLCPGVLRPWPADDGALVRLRLVGGVLTAAQLRAISAVAQRFGDGDVHLTGRANLQLRGLGAPAGPWVDAIEEAGLLPSRTHDLVRNVMVSPLSGWSGRSGGHGGGRADVRPVATELDRLLLADADLADLPGRFLFCLDDGRGDLLRPTDLGLVALDAGTVQLRVGDAWGPLVPLDEAASALHRLARRFAARRGTGPDAAWHVTELAESLLTPVEVRGPDPRLPDPADPLPYGPVPGGEHVAAPDGVLSPALAADLADRAASSSAPLADTPADTPADTLVVTPWKGVLVPC